MHQIHSAIIHHVETVPEKMLQGDGLITDVPGVLLSVRTADCVPVLIADRKKQAVGAFHAGWRGTLARIVEKGVGEMRRQFGSDSKDLVAAIGPCIHACCYEVSDDFPDKFRAQFEYSDSLFEEVFDSNSLHLKYPLLFLNQRAPGHGDAASKLHLNLVEANRRQLLDAGVPENNIWASDLCTSCRTDLLFSHRAEFGQTGRMVAAIWIKL
jgi:polyphenol oxidase